MKITFEFKVFDRRHPVVERHTDIKMCSFYHKHGTSYLKLYKYNSELDYDYCIDLSDVKEFLIED